MLAIRALASMRANPRGQRARRASVLVSLWCLVAVLFPVRPVAAAIWTWRCQGQLGEQQVVFDRDLMVVRKSQKRLGDIRDLTVEKAADVPGERESFLPANSNDGLSERLEFTASSDQKRKIVLIEKSSRKLSSRHRLICGRDEDTDIYRKLYRLQRDGEPDRDIQMQCLEYQLSTRGGRKGCV